MVVRFAAFSLAVVTSAIVSVGVPSSSVMVTVPVAEAIVALLGLLRPTVKVSFTSSKES